MSKRSSRLGWVLSVGLLFWASAVLAFPGLFVSKDGRTRVLRSGQVVVLEGEGKTVVTLSADYSGPMAPFALVVAVPADVDAGDVRVLKGAVSKRLEALTAPRFHVFWEQDPCDAGPVEQEWERNLSVTGERALGKQTLLEIPRKLDVSTVPEFAEGSYTFAAPNVDSAGALSKWLKARGYEVSPSFAEAVAPAFQNGMKFLVAEVDTGRLELLGDGSAVLSPFRFVTAQPYRSLHSRLGLKNLEGHQELLVYVLHPEHRFEVANLKTVLAPTNLALEMSAAKGPGGLKERPGEFYAALHDRVLEREGNTVLTEYAWATDGCGEPCVTSRLSLQELLTLGGDVLEGDLAEADKLPVPAELSEEDAEKAKAFSPEQKKRLEEVRLETARRAALIDRQRYVLTRLHYRYDSQGLPDVIRLGPVPGAVEGGVDLPQGRDKGVKSITLGANVDRFQTRFNFFRPWKSQVKCDAPVRDRWGKRPRHIRDSNKIWAATDLATRPRQDVLLETAVRTPVPTLGIAGIQTAQAAPQVIPAPASKPEPKSGCGCRVSGAASPEPVALFAGALALFGIVLRRRV